MFKSKVLILALSLLTLQGCAAVALTAGSMAADAGIEHTLSGISYKTFVSSMDDARYAVFKTLDRLDMDIADQTQTEDGWVIFALANDRTIEIELEAVTKRVTRIRVIAHKGGFFFKDAATATEVIIQMAETIAADMEASLDPEPYKSNVFYAEPKKTTEPKKTNAVYKSSASYVAPLEAFGKPGASSPALQEASVKLTAPRIIYRFIQQPEPAILTREE